MADVGKIVFSSSCATYGVPGDAADREGMRQDPINPYGALQADGRAGAAGACAAHGLRAVALRYFNAAGADPDGTPARTTSPRRT